MQRSFIIEIFPHNVYLLFQPRILCAMPTQANKDLFKQTYITESYYIQFQIVNIEWLTSK